MYVCVREVGGLEVGEDNTDFLHQYCSTGFLHGNCVSPTHDDFSQDV